jgi:hypothetical protein
MPRISEQRQQQLLLNSDSDCDVGGFISVLDAEDYPKVLEPSGVTVID